MNKEEVKIFFKELSPHEQRKLLQDLEDELQIVLNYDLIHHLKNQIEFYKTKNPEFLKTMKELSDLKKKHNELLETIKDGPISYWYKSELTDKERETLKRRFSKEYLSIPIIKHLNNQISGMKERYSFLKQENYELKKLLIENGIFNF